MRKSLMALTAAAFLFFQGTGRAEAGIGETLIGGTIKTVVRIVLAAANIEKVKAKLISKLDKTDAAEFKSRYARFYELIKDLPQDVKEEYKITPYMTKEQMAMNIESVDKRKIRAIINRIPDMTVTALFKEYLKEA